MLFGGQADIPDSPPPPTSPKPKRNGILLGVIAVVILIAACATTQWAANVAYDGARESFDETVALAADGQQELADALTSLTTAQDAATVIADADTGALMDAAAKDALLAELTEAADSAADHARLTTQPLPTSGEKPTWAWELFGDTARLDEDSAEALETDDDSDEAAAEAATTTEALSAAGIAAVHTAADSAGAFEAAHISARNLDILSLRTAAANLSSAVTLDRATASAYTDLENAAAAMLVSEQSELAEKQGPLQGARLEIEAFARGLAPGVLLDFDWSPYVNGYGDGGSIAGEATWWYGTPGYASIELTNSVAEFWPGESSRALIAHEVGHAISVKCEGMYDDSTQESIEAWATAWAISMGFTDPSNGTSAYDAPPQHLIDAAAGCR